MRDPVNVSLFDKVDAFKQEQQIQREQAQPEAPASLFDKVDAYQSQVLIPDYSASVLEDGRDIDTPVSNSRQDRLSKRDLLAGENMSTIRQYMVRRYGQEMVDRYDTDERLMERFVDSMRFFNGNMIGTVGEATWVADASEEDKASAAAAYDLFDRLGNVFVVDGVGGALDGIKDYVFAAARDPSSYLGLFTGGAAKAATLGSQMGIKSSLRRAASIAGKRALREGLSKEATDAAVAKAVQDTIAQIGDKTLTKKTRKRLLDLAADNARAAVAESVERGGRDAFLKKAQQVGTRNAMIAGFAGDTAAAGLADVSLQNTLLEVGAQERFSVAQTAIGAIVGGVAAPGLQLVGDFTSKLLGRQSRAGEVSAGAIQKKTRDAVALSLSRSERRKAVENIRDAARSWKEKVNAGEESGYDAARIPASFFRDMVFGSEDGKIKGLMSIYLDRGQRLPANVRVTDFFGNLLNDISKKEKKALAKELKGLGLDLGDLDTFKVTLGDVWSAKVSQAAQLLNVSSQIKKTLNQGSAVAEQNMIEQSKEVTTKLAAQEVDPFRYGQSLWRRMLVANPATSMVNIAGFASYYGAQGVAEVLNMSSLMAQGVIRKAIGMGDGKAQFAQAKAYNEMVGQKMIYMLDPHSTREQFEVILDEFDDVKDTLINNLSGGIDIASERYGFSKDNKTVANLETLANLASRLTLVRAQDSVTKSLMFMSELDKRIRLAHNRSLDDVMMAGELQDLVTPDMMNSVMDNTMASIFSKNYTTKGSSNVFFRPLAKGIEELSNMPLLGQVLPFGRFANNVIGNTWRFTAGGMLAPIQSIMKDGKITNDSREAFWRAATAMTFFGMAMQYDKQRQEENLGMFQVRIGDNIYDAENSFPLSLFLAAGRIMNTGGTQEQFIELGEQMVVGNLASDLQFSNTLTAFWNGLTAEDETTRNKVIEGLGKATGGFMAGYTRPLDAVNKLVGAATGTDYARDARQMGDFQGQASVSATKYIDNIVEAFDKLIDDGNVPGVTGETLRVATREGDLRTPNALLSVMGIKQLPGRTAAETALNAVDVQPYKANFYSRNAKYDRLANVFVNDILERRMSNLLNSKRWSRLGNDAKKDAVKQELQISKQYMNQLLAEYSPATENVYIESVRRRAMSQHRANREFAAKMMKERYGVDGDLRDFSLAELQQFMYFASNYDEILEYM